MVLSGDLSQTLITSARLALRAFKAADAAESFEAAKLAVRAEPDKLKGRIIRLAVDQNEIGSDVTVAVIAPLAAERMIEIPSRLQKLVLRPIHTIHQMMDLDEIR
jgi:hypothetical protein